MKTKYAANEYLNEQFSYFKKHIENVNRVATLFYPVILTLVIISFFRTDNTEEIFLGLSSNHLSTVAWVVSATASLLLYHSLSGIHATLFKLRNLDTANFKSFARGYPSYSNPFYESDTGATILPNIVGILILYIPLPFASLIGFYNYFFDFMPYLLEPGEKTQKIISYYLGQSCMIISAILIYKCNKLSGKLLIEISSTVKMKNLKDMAVGIAYTTVLMPIGIVTLWRLYYAIENSFQTW